MPSKHESVEANPSSSQQIEWSLPSPAGGLPSVRFNVDFGYGNTASKERLAALEENLGISVYTPEKRESDEYAGGYHITYVEPSTGEAKRIGIFARKIFKGHMFLSSESKLRFQNYPPNPDILIGSVTEAERIGKSYSEFEIGCFNQFGILLPRQLSDTYSLELGVQKQLEALTKNVDADTKTFLGLSRGKFTLSDPRYNGPLSINLELNSQNKLVYVAVGLPSASVSVDIKKPHSEEYLIKEGQITIPPYNYPDDERSMVNFRAGGWAPVEPAFMK